MIVQVHVSAPIILIRPHFSKARRAVIAGNLVIGNPIASLNNYLKHIDETHSSRIIVGI